MITKYYAHRAYAKITKESFERETASTVFKKSGRRFPKVSSDYIYADSFLEAKSWLISALERDEFMAKRTFDHIKELIEITKKLEES